MKKINIKTAMMSVVLCASVASFLFSCDDINSLHEKYLDRGEGIYLGIADSLQAYSGYHKVKLRWKINADVRITKAIVYWNQREDSKTVPVDRITTGAMWMETDIDGLIEAEYLFELQLQDNDGNVSKIMEVSGASLGDSFIRLLRNRSISEINWLENGDVEVKWGNVGSPTLWYTVLTYTDIDGHAVTLEVPNDETVSVLEKMSPVNNIIEVYSVHIPINGFEAFAAAKMSYKATRWVNITDEVLLNTRAPFSRTDEGPAGLTGGRFFWVTDWIHNDDAKKCATFENNSTGGTPQVICLYTNGNAAYNFTNAKLYQTATLEEGKYRFEVTLIRNMCTAANRVFISVAAAAELPDISNVVRGSLAQSELEVAAGGSVVYNVGSRPVIVLEFDVAATGPVSLGFVAAASTNFLTVFEKVELFAVR